jgi:hypothetical protein
VKRRRLLRHLERQGCEFLREGRGTPDAVRPAVRRSSTGPVDAGVAKDLTKEPTPEVTPSVDGDRYATAVKVLKDHVAAALTGAGEALFFEEADHLRASHRRDAIGQTAIFTCETATS